MPDPELKPCPRCGGSARIVAHKAETLPDRYSVACNRCDLRAGMASSSFGGAADWWNERKAEPTPTEPCGYPHSPEGTAADREPTPAAKAKSPAQRRTCGNCGRLHACDAPNARDTKEENVETPCDASDCGSWYSDDEADQTTPLAFDNFLGKPIDLPELRFAAQPAHPEPPARHPAAPHECPYGGVIEERDSEAFGYSLDGPIFGPVSYRKWECGKAGRLCDRCQQDRADRRQREFIAWSDAKPSTKETQDYLRALEDKHEDLAETVCRRLSALEADKESLVKGGIASATAGKELCGAVGKLEGRVKELEGFTSGELDAVLQRVGRLEERLPALEAQFTARVTSGDRATKQFDDRIAALEGWREQEARRLPPEAPDPPQAQSCPSVNPRGRRCQMLPGHRGSHQCGGIQWWDAKEAGA